MKRVLASKQPCLAAQVQQLVPAPQSRRQDVVGMAGAPSGRAGFRGK